MKAWAEQLDPAGETGVSTRLVATSDTILCLVIDCS